MLAAVPVRAGECPAGMRAFGDFGVVGFGAVTRERMDKLAARTADCDLENDDSCTYRDGNGVSYGFVEGQIESKAIDPRLWHGALPFGLARSDTAAAVRAKIKRRYGIEFEQSTDPATGEIVLSSVVCRGVDIWFVVKFDRAGRLKSIENSVESMRD